MFDENFGLIIMSKLDAPNLGTVASPGMTGFVPGLTGMTQGVVGDRFVNTGDDTVES